MKFQSQTVTVSRWMTVEQVGQEHILGTFVTQNNQPDKHKHLVSNKEELRSNLSSSLMSVRSEIYIVLVFGPLSSNTYVITLQPTLLLS